MCMPNCIIITKFIHHNHQKIVLALNIDLVLSALVRKISNLFSDKQSKLNLVLFQSLLLARIENMLFILTYCTHSKKNVRVKNLLTNILC